MTLVYLYAVVPPAGGAWLASAGLRGIAGGPVRAVGEAGVVGAVSDVPEAEFGQEALDRNVADADWLAPHAAAHQDVNAALLDELGAVLPLAFGTIFRSDDRVREVLRARGAELAAGLAAVAGRVEWVVTLDRDRRAAAAYLTSIRTAPSAEEAGQGRAYLLRRKAEVESTEELRALDREARAAFRVAALAAADEVSEEPIIEGGPAARFTVLVRREREAVLRRAADEFAGQWRERGYEPRLAGPWPAYRYSARLGSLGG